MLTVPITITGLIQIYDNDTGEKISETSNDVLYGNMSTALAHALIGDSSKFLFFIGFGNGGAYVNSTGTIGYKGSLGGAGSLVKNPTANLYNTIYVKKLSNEATPVLSYNNNSKAYIPSSNAATNFEDIIVDVVLGYNEPPLQTNDPLVIGQTALDNSSFVGSTGGLGITGDMFVINEIALYAGPANLLVGENTTTADDVINFVQSQEKIMLTHGIFSPQQKAANRQLNFIYTLRIQMGTI